MGRRGPGAKPTTTARKPVSRPRRRAAGALSRAERVIRWIEGLTITSGAHAGRKFRVRGWQRDIIAAIYAESPETRRRLIRTALISMGRKNGKSGLSAALALCHLCGPEAIPRGQVVSAAGDRQQAALIFDEMRAFALVSPELAQRLTFRDFNKTIEDEVTGSTYGALAADAKKAHGLSPSFAVCDEVAQWRSRELLDAIRSGQGAHAEPLCIIISTRSPDPASPMEELISYADDVRAGIIADRSFAAWIFSAPLDADPWAEATWRLANPALGDFRSLEDVEVQAAEAQRLPSRQPAFRAYVLNQQVAPDDRFISPMDWDACGRPAAAEGPCFGGLDLSSGPADLTSFALYWPDTGRLVCWAFVPAEAIDVKAAEDRAPYRQWQALGHVITTPGRVVDRAWLLEWIKHQVSGLDLRAIGSDRWMLADLQHQAEREGIELPLQPIGQGFKDMSPAIGAFEGLILEQKIAHGGNPLLRWALANSAVDSDPAGNRKLTKSRSRGRIDPAIAAIEACAMAAREEPPPAYEFTGLWVG